MFCTRLANGGLFATGDPIVPFVISPRFECLNKRTHTYTVHMALMGYFIVFSFVTKPGQTLEFLLWGTIVPLNFLAGYHCSIVASTPQPTVYASTPTHPLKQMGLPIFFVFVSKSNVRDIVLCCALCKQISISFPPAHFSTRI